MRELEEKGIGRPSTYATILSTLQERGYVTKDERKRLVPTELGRVVSDLLVENFPRIMEVDFTAKLEEGLDQVEAGKQDWRKLLEEFYGPFSQALETARRQMRQVKGKGLATDLKCPACGSQMRIRLGKHGEFLACSAWPDCDTTCDFTRDEDGNIVPQQPSPDPGLTCDKCGAPMQVKRGPYGPFLACSAYPKCKNVMDLDDQGNPVPRREPEKIGEKCPQCGKGELVIKHARNGSRFISCSEYPKCRYSRGLPLGVACPKCGGELVEKRSRRGKVFYGCDNFPRCDFATWNKPVPRPCPDCGHPFLEERRTKAGPILRCPNRECGYQVSAEEAEEE